MSTQRIIFTIELALRAPILTQAAGAIAFGLDTAMRRDAQGRPCLPGTLIKGNLRHAWDALSNIADTSFDSGHWLGNPSADERHNDPERGILRFDEWFSDLTWSDADQARPRFRISIDPATGATKTGMFQVIESPYPAGREVTFTGHVRATLEVGQAGPLARRIRQGLLFIPAIGALKGNGFGRVVAAKVTWTLVEKRGQSPARDWTDVTRVGLRVRPSAPFCFAKPALGKKNHFESEAFIPGGALIAAIARRIAEVPERAPHLEQNLNQLHITHARAVPATATHRPIAVPLTLVKVGEGFHALQADAPAEPIDGEAPLFQTDWKPEDWAEASRYCNPGLDIALVRRLRIRNSIDAEAGTAEKGVLFSTETIDPDIDPKTGHARVEWLANLDLSKVSDPAAVLYELDDLLREPLTNLGKSKVDADVLLEPTPFALAHARMSRTDHPVAIHLQSPARLLPSEFHCAGSNAGAALEQAYRKTWRDLSGGALELVGFLAEQRLFGGDYWWSRFRARHGEHGYHPEMLTLEGSVFLLRILDAIPAQAKLDDWLARGLPQIDAKSGGEDWQRNPWIRANGFGEIALNLAPLTDGREDHHD